MGSQTKLDVDLKKVYLSYGALITPLGSSVQGNFERMSAGESGVRKIAGSGFNGEDWPLSRIESLTAENRYQELLTQLCSQLRAELGEAEIQSPSTLLIISSTKADIQSLPKDTFASTRSIIQKELRPSNPPLIISNACISGVLAINTAADYIRSGKYSTVIAIGIDALADFIVYGFQSLFALSYEPSQPFDKNRKGIAIGEAAGAIVVRAEQPSKAYSVEYLGGSSSNDANHISGPSRTGEGLFRSIKTSAHRANIDLDQLDFISAHGTGTLYNDEMESIAFDRLGLNKVPLNSLKGYFGHTLGAAGIIEIMSTMLMMEHGKMLRSPGFEEAGTSMSINVLTENIDQPINLALKTASGFGGGNASLILKQVR